MSEEDILLCSLLFSENLCAEFSASQQVKTKSKNSNKKYGNEEKY